MQAGEADGEVGLRVGLKRPDQERLDVRLRGIYCCQRLDDKVW